MKRNLVDRPFHFISAGWDSEPRGADSHIRHRLAHWAFCPVGFIEAPHFMR